MFKAILFILLFFCSVRSFFSSAFFLYSVHFHSTHIPGQGFLDRLF